MGLYHSLINAIRSMELLSSSTRLFVGGDREKATHHFMCILHSGSTHRLLPSLKKSATRKRKKSVITPSESLSQFLLKSCELYLMSLYEC